MSKDKIRIIVIDDMKTSRFVIIKYLGQMGFTNYDEANDGDQALDMINKAVAEGNPYTLILSDWNMPNMLGIDLLKAVRANPATKNTKFIMLTSETEKENIVSAIKAGTNNYASKPFTLEVLKEKINKVLEIA